MISEINALEQTRNLFKGVIEEFKSDFRDLLKSKNMAAANKGFVNGAFSIELNPLLAAAIGTFCSVTTRKATEHSYLSLLEI